MIFQFILLVLISPFLAAASDVKPNDASVNITYADTLMALHVNHETGNTMNDISVLAKFFMVNEPEIAYEYDPKDNVQFNGIIDEILIYHEIVCNTAHKIQQLGMDAFTVDGFGKLVKILMDAMDQILEKKKEMDKSSEHLGQVEWMSSNN